MADKANKKRKRHTANADAPDQETTHPSADNIKVTFNNSNGLQPIVLSSPGLSTPKVSFTAYTKSQGSNKQSILLHSSQHPRLDYQATTPTLPDSQTHYIALYDPATQSLELHPAKHLILQANLRPQPQDQAAKLRKTLTQQREALGREFGTKKAKKVISDRTINAIVSGPAGTPGKSDKEAEAAKKVVLDSMSLSALPVLSEEAKEDAALAAKPIPRPNLRAESVEGVYAFGTLVPEGDAALIPIEDWKAAVAKNEELGLKFLCPSNRVTRVVQSGSTTHLQALRYMTLLLDFRSSLLNAGRKSKKVPKNLTTTLSTYPAALVTNVRQHFSNEDNELPTWHFQNLHTHICALALYIDDWTTHLTDLKQDLRMESKELAQYFRELGAKVGVPTEKEVEGLKAEAGVEGRKRMGREVVASLRVARLRLPLDFPKARAFRRT